MKNCSPNELLEARYRLLQEKYNRLLKSNKNLKAAYLHVCEELNDLKRVVKLD